MHEYFYVNYAEIQILILILILLEIFRISTIQDMKTMDYFILIHAFKSFDWAGIGEVFKLLSATSISHFSILYSCMFCFLPTSLLMYQ